MPDPIDHAHRRQFRAKALEHLEAAHACTDKAEDGMGCYLIGCAIDKFGVRTRRRAMKGDPTRTAQLRPS